MTQSVGLSLTSTIKCLEYFTDLSMTNIKTYRDQVRRNLSFLFKHFIVEVREGTKIESRMRFPGTYHFVGSFYLAL